jgi:hypothetical protein
MATLLLSFAILLLAIAGLALGVMLGRRPLQGSCGGLACAGLSCDTCPNRKTEDTP